jgi:glucosamine kinase
MATVGSVRVANDGKDHDTYFLGIDGGGTKCRATIVTADGTVIGTGLAGPANPFQNTAQTLESILTSTELALEDATLPQDDISHLVAGIGLAGVNLPHFYNTINTWNHPFRKMYLATDLHIACLGAHEGGDGAVIVAGTGSCGYRNINGKTHIYGGHGFPFGDKGSGAWIGLEAVKAALLASDGLGPATKLEQEICEHLNRDLLGSIETLAGATSGSYAQLAPLVFTSADAGDELSIAILREGADYLGSIATILNESAPPRLSMIGGIGKLITPWLPPKLNAQLKPALYEPDCGAVLYAMENWQSPLESTA